MILLKMELAVFTMVLFILITEIVQTKLNHSFSKETAKKLKKVNKGDLIITSTSENIEDVCKAVAWLGDDEIVTGEIANPNRILNTVKTFGNIVCFRNLEKATNESIALFGDKEASGLVLLKSYNDYYSGYKDGDKEVRGYASLVEELLAKFPVGEQIIGEQNQKDFIRLYGAILRVRNILTTFDEFIGNEILTDRDVQDYHSAYIDLYNNFRKADEGDKENINDDLVFEMELIKQIEINIDYIFMEAINHEA